MASAVEILEALELDFPNTVKERRKQTGYGNAYQTIAWVYACSNLIADCISGVTFNLSRQSRKKEPVPLRMTEPAFVCFYPPQKGQIHTISEMIKMQFLHLGIMGESFAALTKKGRNTITGVELFNPALVSPVYTADGSAVQYWNVLSLTAGGTRTARKVSVDDMIQWKYPNPYNPFRGLSPLSAARMAIEQDLNMSTWNSGFFQNGIRNPIAMMLKQTFNPSQREEFMNRLRRNFTGFVKGQLPLLVEGGVDVKVLSNTIKDLDFVEGKSLTREELCAVYGCPPAQVGIFRYANYANSKEQRNIFYLNNLRPKMTYYRDVFQQSILNPFFPGIFCDFAWDEVDAFRRDPAEIKTEAEVIKIKAEAATSLWSLGYDQKQISVIVGEEDYDPSSNQPDPSLENIFMKEEAAAAQAAADAQAIAEAQAAADTEDAEEDAEDLEEDKPKAPPPKKGVTFARAKNLMRVYADSATLRDYARELNDREVQPVVDRLETFVVAFTNQLQKKKGVSESFWVKQWKDTVGPVMDEVFTAGSRSIDQDLRIIRPAELRVPKAIDYEKFLALRYIVTGVSPEKVGSLKLQSIVHRCFNLGRLHAMELARTVEHTWCCAGDNHRELHGIKAKFGKKFEGTAMTYPGEGEYKIDSCTCTIFPTEVLRDELKVAVVKKA